MRAKIHTLWRTASEQCELVFFDRFKCRLQLWVRGVLVVDEEVTNSTQAIKRATELRIERAAHS